MRSTATGLLCLLLLCGCETFKVRRNLPYGPGDRQTYDVYEPKLDVQGSPRPVLLTIHGGGYVGGDKSWAEDVAEKYCPFGWVVFAINYTLADGTAAHAWPAQLDDATAALEYMRKPQVQSWLKIREPIAGFGVSAGAHLVAALHLKGNLPLAVCNSGPMDFFLCETPQLDEATRMLLGQAPGTPISPAHRLALSPVNWVKPDADVFLSHAKHDPTVPYANAPAMKAALEAVGAKVVLKTMDTSEHSSAWKDATWSTREWLREKQ